ncbi:MCE family protein [Mycolicibacterium rhodesiae]|uniref:Mammalian cell entry protein n=1 Tax=Mycolicibacterium rhodesiae TaxID=36814 RepID=A0A1X0IJ87_MYCRH|nr:MCE family protein [Mycolicibacterium rhodesiae]MCV7342935.1 MCE family protein [Mycolicibacterium rhodesiae]ORB47839.1 mammalian cell entry protein [Mycolicibacterium rhodesiae]
MMRTTSTLVKFGVFAVVMVVLTAFLFLTFSNYRSGSTNGYSAVFGDASRLKDGDTVRVAGVRVGTVNSVDLQPDKSVLVKFDADRDIVLTTGTQAAVRYLNLTGDRYLELVDGPGSTRVLPAGSQIPRDRTQSALDLDLLLGGLRPVIQGLNPQDVNALTASLINILQGQGDTLDSLLGKTTSFSNALADNSQTVEQLIDNLKVVVDTLAKDGDKFSGAIDKLEKLITGLSQDREPIGTAITQLDNGTASLTSLLNEARAPLKGDIEQLNRLAPLLDDNKIVFDRGLQRGPDNYRKMARLGAYGSWIMYYICGLSIRVTDLQGRTGVFPMIKQESGRCAEP